MATGNAYAGRFTDRSPKIHPAGYLEYKKEDSVARTVFQPDAGYDIEELQTPKKIFDYPLPPLLGDQYAGFYTKMRSLIQSPPKSIFQGLLEEFKETRYDSYWNKRLGRTRDYSSQLPPKIDPETFCFGIKNPEHDIKELLNPTNDDEFDEAKNELYHNMYKKTHYDYYPGEQFDRGYDSPCVNKHLVWGKRVPHDKSGKLFRCANIWPEQVEIGDIQKQFLEKTRKELGKSHAPNKNIENLPKGFRFGDISQAPEDKYEILKCLRYCPLDINIFNFIDTLQIINSLRIILSKRAPTFPYNDFIATFQYRDKGLTGFLDFEVVYEICMLFNIQISRQTLKSICDNMKIINDNNFVNYESLVELICSNKAFPKLEIIKDIPEELLEYVSDYQDHYEKTSRAKGKKAKRYNDNTLSGESDVREVILPSIFTQYGITYHDLFKVLDKEKIKRIFKKICIEIPEDKFETVWEIASKKDKNGNVSLHTFKEALSKESPDIRILF